MKIRNTIRPPRLASLFFEWYCENASIEDLHGDMEELFYSNLERTSPWRAKVKYVLQVLSLVFSYAVKKRKSNASYHPYSNNSISIAMIKSYFIIAWRNLMRNRGFSLINISGLSLGITCSLLIFLWVNDELHVDASQADDNVYNVYERIFTEGKVDAGPWVPGQLASELKWQIPEIKYATGFWTHEQETLFTVGDKKLSLHGCAADSDFFKMFHYTLLKGSAMTALNDPDAITVSRKMAVAFFGSVEAAFGSTIRMNNAKDFKITAVFENVPDNDSKQFDFISNWKDLLQAVPWLKMWIYRGPFTYIQLQPNANVAATEGKIKNFLTPYLTEGNGAGFRTELGLQPYHEMYLHSTFVNGVPQGGRIEYVQLFSLIAVAILLIACINFMNLATARSAKRAKEVGIRKTVGAVRSLLTTQFIGEAILITLLSLILALVAVVLLLPSFNSVTDKHITMPFASPMFWMGIAGLLIFTGLIAGSYPAFFLSSLNPVRVLKGSLQFSQNTLRFRKALVVFQFTASIAIITGTVIVSTQVDYVQSKSLGFDNENLLYIPFQGDLINKYDVFKQQLLSRPGIESVTRSTNAPSHINTHEYDLEWEGKNPEEKVVAIHNGIGYDFLKMMNIPMVEGRDFSKEFPSDSNAFIINETALKVIGYKDPIGKPLTFFQRRGTIVGVVKDFHLKSLREPIQPLILFLGEEATWGYVLVKAQSGKTLEAITAVEQVFKEMEPEFPVRYYFADEEYQKLYRSEMTVSKLSDSFSVLAIFISCLGLLGLTLFTVEQRKKEIGIRKVIGASVPGILAMLSKDIVKLVMLSSLLAAPVAWLAMERWLQNFAYRITINVWLFVITAMAALLIALLTISYQAIQAAMANPVKSLKTE